MMTYKPDLKHLTIVGFADTNKKSAFVKAGNLKLKKAQDNIVGAKKDFSSVLSKTIEDFKAESIIKINHIDSNIADIKLKMTTSGEKIGALYKDEIIRLEHSKTFLLSKLEEFKDEGDDKWEDFKSEFMNDLEGFNRAIKDFVENFK